MRGRINMVRKHRVRLDLDGKIDKIDIPRNKVKRIVVDDVKIGKNIFRLNLDMKNIDKDLEDFFRKIRR